MHDHVFKNGYDRHKHTIFTNVPGEIFNPNPEPGRTEAGEQRPPAPELTTQQAREPDRPATIGEGLDRLVADNRSASEPPESRSATEQEEITQRNPGATWVRVITMTGPGFRS